SIVDGWLTASEGVGITLTNATGEEGISTTDQYGCVGNGDRTSFLNFMRPEVAPTGWQPENPWDGWDPTSTDAATRVPKSPIAISRHGNPLIDTGLDCSDSYFVPGDFPVANNLAATIVDQDTRVNAVMISGVVPMRRNQSYGGLHNFPRFISQWTGSDLSSSSQRALNIAGAFFQLNYSNYATGPFDQDAFETSQDASTSTFIPYYYPPKRLWGYDVGLQYAQAGPISQRFVSASEIRSEFYSEPAADDPYIENLCRAMVTEAGGSPDAGCAS
ncbi:MAG: hypothetical protein F6K65_42160, partial [Moorea sp. SIO3C2]|nr:hypothetical protein [Moorena sp. SIO3C2]